MLTAAMLWFSRVDTGSGYWGTLLPGMLALAIGWAACSSRSPSTAVSKVRNTDAGLASALLNVGQQVGGALGLSVMTTVFGTSARNYASDHSGALQQQLVRATARQRAADRRDRPADRLGRAERAATRRHQRLRADACRPASRPTRARSSTGPTATSRTTCVAHASGQGFLTGAVFGVVAIIAAVVLINVKKTTCPRRPQRRRRPKGAIARLVGRRSG